MSATPKDSSSPAPDPAGSPDSNPAESSPTEPPPAETSGAERSGAERSGAERSGAERSGAEPSGTEGPAAPAAKKRGPGRGRGQRGECLFRHFRIDELLAADDRVAYEALLLDPRQTVDSLVAWLYGRGYVVSRGAVHRHRRHFELDVKEIRKSARVACQFSALARASGGPGSLADAGQFRFEQMFLERLFSLKDDDRLSGKEWTEFGKAMSTLLDNRQRYEALRAEWEQKAKRAAAELEKPGARGKPEPDVVARVREILGV